MFEKWGKHKISNTFVEDYSRAWTMVDEDGEPMGCATGEWMYGEDHTCGIGRGYDEKWRHLDHRGRPLEQHNSEWLKKIKAQGNRVQMEQEMEDDMAKMELDGEARVKSEPLEHSEDEDERRDQIKIKIEKLNDEEIDVEEY